MYEKPRAASSSWCRDAEVDEDAVEAAVGAARAAHRGGLCERAGGAHEGGVTRVHMRREARAGGLQGIRITIDANQMPSLRSEHIEQGRRVAAATERRVDIGAGRIAHEPLDRLCAHHGDVVGAGCGLIGSLRLHATHAMPPPAEQHLWRQAPDARCPTVHGECNQRRYHERVWPHWR